MNEKVKQIGNLTENPKRDNPQTYRVYDKEGISPTLNCMQGGNLQPMIIEDFYKNREPRVYDETAPTIRAEREGLKVIEPKVVQAVGDRGNHSYSVKEISNTIPANAMSDRGQMILEPKMKFGRMGRQAVETFNEKQPSFGSTINPFNKTIDTSDICPAITTRPEGFKTAILPVTQNYRIRKLTPKECWWLMGFTDEDFNKAEKVNSNSQLYKQAGNSIVVEVLEGIFKQMLRWPKE